MTKIFRYCVIVLFTALFAGCAGGACDVLPDVTFHTSLNRASHISIYSPNGFEYANGGVCGLIVYNSGNGLVAYDRCSTVDPGSRNRVRVEGLQIIDEKSGAKWLLTDGSPTHIAECSLRRYSVRRNGDNYIVSN